MTAPWSNMAVVLYNAFIFGAWVAATGFGWRAAVGGYCTWMVVAPLLRAAHHELPSD